ncbi:shikimate dehydrogenase [Acidisphaera sp. L21]|uniref:shikimate dehydrogenase n=1 Tax=Acidisphaera sp. L21 TaxID=1641851 RepID=UPI00131E881E|nr:shikimate dehydrogenase [Acidisphaera sp. L21]
MSRPAILLGLIGSGIAASLTPAMHEREGDEQGLRSQYKLIDLMKLGVGADALPDLLLSAERMGFAGLNITFPCKQAVLPLLHELSDDAKFLGAVNTVVLRDGRRVGHNTDWWGFAENFRRRMPDAARRRVVQMGAGGAGAAVAYAAMMLGAEHLTIIDVDPAKAEAVAGSLSARFGAGTVTVAADPAAAIGSADGLINTTPIGMEKFPGTPLPVELLRSSMWVAEIIYFPLETALLRAARAIGCRTVDGGGMAVFQAVQAFHLFTGLQPDAERMLRHFTSMVQPQTPTG